MDFRKNLENIKKDSLFIDIPTIVGPIDSYFKVNGKIVLNLCSNNYLGFANNPNLKKAAIKAINKFGLGPSAVRTIAGTTTLHLLLEKKLAEFKKTEAVITFQSGFVANLATIPAITQENDIIYSDELNHASIIDAIRLSHAQVIKYKHKDLNDLQTLLKKSPKNTGKLIVTDGVFSMDGDIAPLPDLVKIAKIHHALIMVDDAHGEGVLGKNGRGIVDHFNLHGKVDLEVGTMSKAFGVIGGMVAGKKEIIDWLRQRARPFLFSSAMTFADVAACIKAVEILSKSDKLVKKLWQNTIHFKKEMNKLGFDTGKSETPIVPVMLGEVKLAREFSQLLMLEGVFAKAIGYPTVAKDKARIRVMNSATLSINDLNKALRAFKKVGKKLNVID